MYQTLSPGRYEFDVDYNVKKQIAQDFKCEKLNTTPNHYGAFTVTHATSNDQKYKEIILENGERKEYHLAGNELDVLMNGLLAGCNISGGRRRRSRKASKKRRKTRRHRKSRRHH